jgi:hypothetical protein
VTSDVYEGMRGRILDLDPAEVSFTPTPDLPDVFGVVMEIGHGGGVATLVALRGGMTSLYFSTGGGMIGGGEHPQVAAATQVLIRTAQAHLASVPASTDTALPAAGRVVLRVLTYGGRRALEAGDDELVAGEHPLSPVFYAADDVITQLRLLDEARER